MSLQEKLWKFQIWIVAMSEPNFNGMSNEDVLKTAQLEHFRPIIRAASTAKERDEAWGKVRLAADAAHTELRRRGVDMFAATQAIDCIGGGWPNSNRDRQWVIDYAVKLVK